MQLPTNVSHVTERLYAIIRFTLELRNCQILEPEYGRISVIINLKHDVKCYIFSPSRIIHAPSFITLSQPFHSLSLSPPLSHFTLFTAPPILRNMGRGQRLKFGMDNGEKDKGKKREIRKKDGGRGRGMDIG